jgi:hypothetical protein
MITTKELDTTLKALDGLYESSEFVDHNYPTPMEIVNFVETISKSNNVMAERNVEWVLNNKVNTFLSVCKNKQAMLEIIKETLNLNVNTLTPRDVNISKGKGSMNYSEIDLRTNYPFTDENAGKARFMIWDSLIEKDWNRNYKSIISIQDSTWALADTAGNGMANKRIRKFLLPKLEWFVWNDADLFKPHATVETCTTKIGRSNQSYFDVYDEEFNIVYRADKKTTKYIFRSTLVKKLYELQQSKFGVDYTESPFNIQRNEMHRRHEEENPAPIFSLSGADIDNPRIKISKTTLVDKHFGQWRVMMPLFIGTRPGISRTMLLHTISPDEAVQKDYMSIPFASKQECDSFISLFQSEFSKIILENTIYSRGINGRNVKFIGQFPLDRIWTTESILKFLNCKDNTILGEILELDSETEYKR